MMDTRTAGRSDEDRAEATLWGVVAEFTTVDDLLVAAEAVRDAGFERWDAHTPFVVHGLDGAMGVRATRLPFLVLGAGLTGTLAGLGLQIGTNAFDYPWVISGKPLISLPAFIPVTFELTILLAAITALVAMLALNGLPQHYHPLHTVDRFRRATDDRFFISIEASDERYAAERTRALLERSGAVAVEEVYE